MASRIVGIDFSGARFAGRKIWIAEAERAGARLAITSLERADRLLDVSARREEVIPALADFIAAQGDAIIGIDFPFSVPAPALFARPWKEFALQAQARFADQDELREWCWQKMGDREVLRETERVAQTPFSAYNRWIKFQTYYGITKLIAPLVRAGTADFPPMTTSGTNPKVIEACPASTIKALGISAEKYKGRGEERRARRSDILESLKRRQSLSVPKSITDAAIANADGDALDAIVAAIATARAAKQLASGDITLHGPIDEGHVFF